MKGTYTVTDLFPGVGSMSLAAEKAGFKVEAALEFEKDEKLKRTYHRNLGKKNYIFADISQSLPHILPESDVLVGNIPFGFSAGRLYGRYKSIWEYLCEIVSKNQPEAFLFVASVKTIQGGAKKERDHFWWVCRESGYNLASAILDSQEITGMPVNEKKLYFVGIRGNRNVSYQFPLLSHGYSYTVSDFLQKDVEKEFYQMNLSDKEIDIKENADFYLWKRRKYEASKTIIYTSWKPVLVVEDERIRRITYTELARTKCFPDEFKWETGNRSWIYRQIGKSVNVQIVYELLNHLHEILDEKILPFETKAVVTKTDNKISLPVVKKVKKDTETKPPIFQKPRKEQKKIFLSYCQKDKDIVQIIDEKLAGLIGEEFYISRDVRDVQYKDSFKEFMKTIRQHDFVIMVISDRYIKSRNCMYEVMEVFKERNYAEKLLFIVLSNADKKYFKEEVSDSIGADIYTPSGQAQYTIFWNNQKKEIEKLIKEIENPVYAASQLKEAGQIEKIMLELPEFFDYIADVKGLPLEEHMKSNFRDIIKKLRKDDAKE